MKMIVFLSRSQKGKGRCDVEKRRKNKQSWTFFVGKKNEEKKMKFFEKKKKKNNCPHPVLIWEPSPRQDDVITTTPWGLYTLKKYFLIEIVRISLR